MDDTKEGEKIYILKNTYYSISGNMKIPERPSRLIELIESYRREDGSVWMSIGVSEISVMKEVMKRLSSYGVPLNPSPYVPFFDLVLPDIGAADRFVKKYDASQGQGDFEHVKSLEVPCFYEAAKSF